MSCKIMLEICFKNDEKSVKKMLKSVKNVEKIMLGLNSIM